MLRSSETIRQTMQFETALFGNPLYFSSPSVFHENLLDHSEKSQHVTSLECILISKIDKEMVKYIINGAYQNNKQKKGKVYFAVEDHTRTQPNENISLPFQNLSLAWLDRRCRFIGTTQIHGSSRDSFLFIAHSRTSQNSRYLLVKD